jgi:hypothetical protein
VISFSDGFKAARTSTSYRHLWRGLSFIHEVLQPRTYKIQYENGRVVTNVWNIEHLRPIYP